MMKTLKLISKGKVREIYDLGPYLLIVTTDQISAFDVVLSNIIPKKGILLNQLSELWFAFIEEKNIIPHHMISTDNQDMPLQFRTNYYQDRCMIVKKLEMIPIECIVRGYITGSGWDSYQKTGTVCGIRLPDGLQESEKLNEPIYTPSTKATHDENISFEQTIPVLLEFLPKTVAYKGKSEEEITKAAYRLAEQLKSKSIEIYSVCSEYARTRGIIIADTKFEFGLDVNGNLVLADEVLTPDSSRFWPADEYEVGKSQNSFDKQYVRDYLTNTDWDKKSPAPKLPKRIIKTTLDKYTEILDMLT